MSFKLIKTLSNGVRIGELTTPHGKIETPFFMPVGTVGSVKSVSPDELEALSAQIVLSNTYHLYLRPGEKLIKKLGGLHTFMNWSKPILTDSGGYQVFSLARGNNHNKAVILNESEESPEILRSTQDDRKKGLVNITNEGVEFKSHLDGSSHFFTPEKVIDIQLDLGVDILMPLDVCPSGKASREEIEKSVELTIKWAKRAKIHFDKRLKEKSEYRISNIETNSKSINNKIKNNSDLGFRASGFYSMKPLLHGIVQGGLYEDLRRECAAELIKLDFDGYSVGGLAVDHETRDMWKIVELMGEILPENKQRYLMGVGTPDDIIIATKLGMDMFDCVLPTRLARHGSVYVKSQKSKVKTGGNYTLINLLNSKYRTDGGVIDEKCACPACKEGKGFSRAYISHLIRSNEILGIRLTTLHNLFQYLELIRKIRES